MFLPPSFIIGQFTLIFKLTKWNVNLLRYALLRRRQQIWVWRPHCAITPIKNLLCVLYQKYIVQMLVLNYNPWILLSIDKYNIYLLCYLVYFLIIFVLGLPFIWDEKSEHLFLETLTFELCMYLIIYLYIHYYLCSPFSKKNEPSQFFV